MMKKTITLILLVVVILLIVIVASNNQELSNTNNYLGFSEEEVEVSNEQEMGNVLFSFVDNLRDLNNIDQNLYNAAQQEDVNQFFDQHKLFNEKTSMLMGQARGLALFDEGVNTTSMFATPVFAKKRSSFWYYVPILGSLMKAKHESIETSRAGVYNYLKENLDSVDRESKLNEYGFKNVEELRNASDKQVEKIARDPELRSGIDWTKVSTDLGEVAVETVVEANQAVLAGEFNPLKGAVENAKDDLLDDGRMQGMEIEDQMDDNKGGLEVKRFADQMDDKRVTLGLRESATAALEASAGDVLEKKWSEIDNKKQEKIYKKVKEHAKEKPLMMAHESENSNHSLNLTPGSWSFNTVALGGRPINIDNVDIEKGKVKQISPDRLNDNNEEQGQVQDQNKDLETESNQEENQNQLQDNREDESSDMGEQEQAQDQEQNGEQNMEQTEEEAQDQGQDETKEQDQGQNEEGNNVVVDPVGERVQASGIFNMSDIQGSVSGSLYPEGGPLFGSMDTPLGEAIFDGGVDYSGNAHANLSGRFGYPDPETGIMVYCSVGGSLSGVVTNNSLSGNFNATCATDHYKGTWNLNW